MIVPRIILVILILYTFFLASSDAGNFFRFNKVKKHSKFGSFFSLAKDYLQNANIYNTSVEFTVPLFSFTFPTLENPNDYTSLIKQNLIGQAIFFIVIIVSFFLSIAFPVFINDVYPQSRTFSNVQHYHNILLGAMHRFQRRQSRGQVGVCLRHTACEAYTNYEEFGLLVLPFRFITQSMTSTNTSQWQNHTDCNKLHECPFSILRLLRYLGNFSLQLLGLT